MLKRKGRQPIIVTNCAELKLINENLINGRQINSKFKGFYTLFRK